MPVTGPNINIFRQITRAYYQSRLYDIFCVVVPGIVSFFFSVGALASAISINTLFRESKAITLIRLFNSILKQTHSLVNVLCY